MILPHTEPEGPAPVRVVVQQLQIFLQSQSQPGHDGPVGSAHIAEMPGLVGNAGDVLFSCGIAEDEAIVSRLLFESTAHAGIREVGADKVNMRGRQAQVDG